MLLYRKDVQPPRMSDLHSRFEALKSSSTAAAPAPAQPPKATTRANVPMVAMLDVDDDELREVMERAANEARVQATGDSDDDEGHADVAAWAGKEGGGEHVAEEEGEEDWHREVVGKKGGAKAMDGEIAKLLQEAKGLIGTASASSAEQQPKPQASTPAPSSMPTTLEGLMGMMGAQLGPHAGTHEDDEREVAAVIEQAMAWAHLNADDESSNSAGGRTGSDSGSSGAS